jgi:hypothetical protein
MKTLIFSLLFSVMFIASCKDKSHEESKMECCKKDVAVVEAGGNKVVVSDTNNLSCSLTSAELDKRKRNVLDVIKSKIKERKELKDGYSFRFENSDETIDMITEFIKSERQCCNFFNFSMTVKNDGTLWFDLTGPKEAKEVIGTELGL